MAEVEGTVYVIYWMLFQPPLDVLYKILSLFARVKSLAGNLLSLEPWNSREISLKGTNFVFHSKSWEYIV